ncbi:MAG: hypothetical protein AAF357_16505 [Verrucomicrobiota bacterium]
MWVAPPTASILHLAFGSENRDHLYVNEEIAMLAAVAEAEEDIREGRLVENKEMKARLDSWLDG